MDSCGFMIVTDRLRVKNIFYQIMYTLKKKVKNIQFMMITEIFQLEPEDLRK